VPRQLVAILSQKDEAVALAKALMTPEEVLARDHGLACRTVRVLMPRDTYPRSWRPKSKGG